MTAHGAACDTVCILPDLASMLAHRQIKGRCGAPLPFLPNCQASMSDAFFSL
jgi:hypothetical protein